MQVSVLLAGMLTGMGRTAPCEIIARRSPLEGGGFAFAEIVILHAPADFPTGDYTLAFNDVQMPVKHVGVLWTIVENRPALAREPAGRVEAPRVQPPAVAVANPKPLLKKRKSRAGAAK
ncbi:MAG TPA: hypothetical protein VKB38_13555 [Terracidiphilus sp.]|nr:hypothetical protein [Terracidiphilus sp.]